MQRFIILLISLFAFHFASAQTDDVNVSAIGIIRLVTDGNTKLNKIYSERVYRHEDEQASLRQSIYAANTELMETRSKLVGHKLFDSDKQKKLFPLVSDLQTALDDVDSAMNDTEIQNSINTVKEKAKNLKKIIKKLVH